MSHTFAVTVFECPLLFILQQLFPMTPVKVVIKTKIGLLDLKHLQHLLSMPDHCGAGADTRRQRIWERMKVNNQLYVY